MTEVASGGFGHQHTRGKRRARATLGEKTLVPAAINYAPFAFPTLIGSTSHY